MGKDDKSYSPATFGAPQASHYASHLIEFVDKEMTSAREEYFMSPKPGGLIQKRQKEKTETILDTFDQRYGGISPPPPK